jgi:hypothetical protein
MNTDTFVQPAGSELFGGQTEEEWIKNYRALSSALKPLGFILDRPRKMSIAEQM